MKNTLKIVASHGNENNSEETKVAHPKMSKQDVNLRKRGFLHFQIGLIIALILVYFGLQATFMMKKDMIAVHDEEIKELVEYYPELVSFVMEKPKVIMEVTEVITDPNEFKIVENDDPIANNITEFIQKPNNIPVRDLDYGSIPFDDGEKVIEKIPFKLVEDAPIFPGCEDVEKKERFSCFQAKMQKHIKKNVKYPAYEQELGIEGKVYVVFDIDVDGSISNLKFKSPTKGFEKEAERIMRKLPQMTPGMQRRVPVKVPFSIPINFRLQ
ncbi:MAG: hypothetical protein COA50_03045 [Flavobacteriaceae bacterium]|nr:MAG: hypothetical protein COA50_03045 [Flavobacteriaceae bacterium]